MLTIDTGVPGTPAVPSWFVCLPKVSCVGNCILHKRGRGGGKLEFPTRWSLKSKHSSLKRVDNITKWLGGKTVGKERRQDKAVGSLHSTRYRRLGFVFLGGNGNLVLQVPTPEFVFFFWEREFVPIVSGPEEIPSLPLADWHAALRQR